MLVRNWMHRNVITIDQEDSMAHAAELIREHKVHMLPVTRKGKLVGVVSDSDVKRASASDATALEAHELLYILAKLRVEDIMTRNPVTVPPDHTVEETAELLLQNNISGVPVVDENGAIAGTITRDDLFKVLIALSGLAKKGIQFAFKIEDRPGSIKELTDIIRLYDGRIASILSSYARVPPGSRIVYIRAYGLDREKVPELVAELNTRGEMYYMVDHRENKRQIFHSLEE